MLGLTYAIGTEVQPTINAFKSEFSRAGFQLEHIHLSRVLHVYAQDDPVLLRALARVDTPDRPEALQQAGSRLRELEGAHAFAAIATSEIEESLTRGASRKNPGTTVYLIQSLKRKEEVEWLRRVLGPSFFLVSLHSRLNSRISTLTRQLRGEDPSLTQRAAVERARRIDATDDDPHGISGFGPQLSKTFSLGDVFLDADHGASRDTMVTRFVQLLFSNPIRTPTKIEFGMFHAHGAMVRSSALSRQVGAAIAEPDGEIVSVGTNDVPRARGGLYWDSELPDARDFRMFDKDPVDELKLEIICELLTLVSGLAGGGSLSVTGRRRAVKGLAKRLVGLPAFKPAQFNVLDVSRTVHAEMDALLDAARRGVSVKDCVLYTTTFPCHNCAKHIVAAGISRVHYIEPYAKSIATKLYPDSIEVDPTRSNSTLVPFTPFLGIAPRRYLELFTASSRTDGNGSILVRQGLGSCRFEMRIVPDIAGSVNL